MVRFKKRLFRFFFAIESALFIWSYLFGAQGIHTVVHMKKENAGLMYEIQVLHEEIDRLKDVIARWQTYPFYKEKCAREELQMARAIDEIYFIK